MAGDNRSTEVFPSEVGSAHINRVYTEKFNKYQRHLVQHQKTLHLIMKCREIIKLAIIFFLSFFASCLAVLFTLLLAHYMDVHSEAGSTFLLWGHPVGAICIMMFIVLSTIAGLCAAKNQVGLLDADDRNIMRRAADTAASTVVD